ncbi:MAG: prepilin peptidase [Puniceicoccales bacterium]|nr:prepilin peptidase [Puniceicoccales bacterium]
MTTLPASLSLLVYFISGAIVGSFLNVCILRLPGHRSIVKPRSKCYHCSKPIPWFYNIPILTWFWLRGKTACCRKRLPIRYPLVECLTGLLAVVVGLYVHTAPIAIFTLACLLLVAFFTDVDTMLIPDEITLGGIVVGCLFCFFYPELQRAPTPLMGMLRSLQNTCLAMGGLFGFASFAEFFLKKEAMGLGDVKLLGCIGAFCGWETCCFAIFFGATLGTCFFVIVALIQRFKGKRVHLMHKMIPFGPFIVVATLCDVLVEPHLSEKYVSFILLEKMM